MAPASDCRKSVSAECTLVITDVCTQHPGEKCENHLSIATPDNCEVRCDKCSIFVAGQPIKVSLINVGQNMMLPALRGDDWNAEANVVRLTADGKQLKLSGHVCVCRHNGNVMQCFRGENMTMNMNDGHMTVQTVAQTPAMPSSEACETPDSQPDPLAYLIWYGLFGSW